ncbi:MAG TPA: hypothetical protein VNR60_10875 [Croceibacterium sp.]|nr:hypothetical protein [Croceibacterium sp.]
MIALLKAVVLGAVLAFVVALFIGSGGSSGGMLNVHTVAIQGHQFFWSWPLFLLGTGISFGLFLLME